MWHSILGVIRFVEKLVIRLATIYNKCASDLIRYKIKIRVYVKTRKAINDLKHEVRVK